MTLSQQHCAVGKLLEPGEGGRGRQGKSDILGKSQGERIKTSGSTSLKREAEK